MGACSSCLGLNRRCSSSDPLDTSQLLGDGYQPSYGGTANAGAPVADPEEIRRQRDALERLCAQTSDKLIDVSHPTTAIAPPEADSTTAVQKSQDLHLLFIERFNSVGMSPFPMASRSSSVSTAHQLPHDHASWKISRPSTSGSASEAEDDEAWLARILQRNQDAGSNGETKALWDQVIGAPTGRLTLRFEDVVSAGKDAAATATR